MDKIKKQLKEAASLLLEISEADETVYSTDVLKTLSDKVISFAEKVQESIRDSSRDRPLASPLVRLYYECQDFIKEVKDFENGYIHRSQED